MIDSWIFYLIVLGFGFLAIYLMDIGIGLIVGGFCLFLYSQHRLRQLDIEQWKLNQSFNKAKKDNQFEINADGTETKKDSIL